MLHPQQAAQLEAQRAADLAAQQAVNAATQQAAQAKQDQLNAVNQQIAALNAKYAADVENVGKNDPWSTQCFLDLQKQNLYTKYIQDYNVLMAQWQQIKYSN